MGTNASESSLGGLLLNNIFQPADFRIRQAGVMSVIPHLHPPFADVLLNTCPLSHGSFVRFNIRIEEASGQSTKRIRLTLTTQKDYFICFEPSTDHSELFTAVNWLDSKKLKKHSSLNSGVRMKCIALPNDMTRTRFHLNRGNYSVDSTDFKRQEKALNVNNESLSRRTFNNLLSKMGESGTKLDE